MNKLLFYVKMGYKLLKKDVVDKEDYKEEYDKISDTYEHWLKEMGRYTEKIIKPELAVGEEGLRILDFACGTGYITKKLLEKNINCEITAVDYSEGMLERLREAVGDRVRCIQSEGLKFLTSTEEKYDIIYFGWALSYFNHKELFKLFGKVLKPGGIVGIITNAAGTLSGVEEIFLKVMAENQEMLIKPMDIKFNLPDGREGLVKWFKDYGFVALEVGEGEVKFNFDKPEELLDWINKTGAAAGTAKIFRDYDKIKDKIVNEIRRTKCINGKYQINHKFAYGIFRTN